MYDWAIQDCETGEWFIGGGNGWRSDMSPLTFATYTGTMRAVAFSHEHPSARASARIVPTPPREMTNAEAEAWLHAQGSDWWVRATAQGTQAWKCGYGPLVGYGDTLHDAIRAASKLERR